jgi:hypothetical protein
MRRRIQVNTIDLNGFTIPVPTMLSALLAVVLVVITMPACSTRGGKQTDATTSVPRTSLITRVVGVSLTPKRAARVSYLDMARPVSRDPWKVVTLSCSIELWKEVDEAVKAIGITKRELVEAAVRRELALRRTDGHYGRSDGQEALPA